MVDDRHSERFWAGVRGARRRVQLGLLPRSGIHAAGLGQMTVVAREYGRETESSGASLNVKNSSWSHWVAGKSPSGGPRDVDPDLLQQKRQRWVVVDWPFVSRGRGEYARY